MSLSEIINILIVIGVILALALITLNGGSS